MTTPMPPDPEKITLKAAVCLYCGHDTPYIDGDENAQAKAWADLLEHDLTCEKNPLIAKIKKLEAQVNSGKVAWCIYCRQVFPYDEWDCESVEQAMTVLKEHHQHCECNPLVQENKRLLSDVNQLKKMRCYSR
jgi:hypothetical protein